MTVLEYGRRGFVSKARRLLESGEEFAVRFVGYRAVLVRWCMPEAMTIASSAGSGVKVERGRGAVASVVQMLALVTLLFPFTLVLLHAMAGKRKSSGIADDETVVVQFRM